MGIKDLLEKINEYCSKDKGRDTHKKFQDDHADIRFTEQRQRVQQHLRTAMDHLIAGDLSYLHLVYEAFADDEPALMKEAGDIIAEGLQGYSRGQMLKLSDEFRKYTSMEWNVNWREVSILKMKEYCSPKGYRYALILGTFHPNGYFRERSMKEISHYPQTLEYLILRTNDWVEPVRNGAMDLCIDKINLCSKGELLQGFSALRKVRQASRRKMEDIQRLEDKVLTRLEEEWDSSLMEMVLNQEVFLRRDIYRAMFTKKVIGKEDADYLLLKEGRGEIQQIIILGILHHYDLSTAQIDEYLLSPLALVRKQALELKYALVKGDWKGLEQMLLDTNTGIRELVSFILRRHTRLNILDFYITHLNGPYLEVAIKGIGEHGRKGQENILMPFLKYENMKIVKVTILALGKLMGNDGGELYWEHLLHQNTGISKAAYTMICNHKIHFGAKILYDHMLTGDTEHGKRYLFNLLLREKSWKRLPYLLILLDDPDLSQMKQQIIYKISQVDLYENLTKEEAEQITILLDQKAQQLPAEIMKQLRFDLKHATVGR